MPLITEEIMKQMKGINEPRVTTQESTITAPQEGLDLGSMGLILAMLLGMGGDKPIGAGLPDVATGGAPQTGFVGGLQPSSGVPSPIVADGAPPINPQTLQMLMSMLGGAGRGF